MATREAKVETYLHEQVKLKLGGMTRKWESKTHAGVTDRIVFDDGDIIFVEVKTTDGRLSAFQTREHDRLRAHGAMVFTLYGHTDVDEFIKARLRCRF
jgi:hypothetical protein